MARQASVGDVATTGASSEALEAELQASRDELESVRLLGEEFVGIVAHELRTPLSALRGYLQMLDRRAVEVADRRLLRLALEQADRLHRMLEELFDVTRADRGRFVVERQPVALGELLEETIEIAQGLSERHRFALETDDRDLIAPVDRGRLQQVVLNLVTNAIVHAPDAPDVAIRLRRLRRRAQIEVEDHGPGIPTEQRDALFLPFEQGQTSGGRHGLGLGLYIAREIVVAHGGRIEVDSQPGNGTTFRVSLPLDARPPQRSGDGRTPAPRAQRDRSRREQRAGSPTTVSATGAARGPRRSNRSAG